jgi:hypothetical protein
LFFVPILIHIVFAIRRRAPSNLPLLKGVYRSAGAVLILIVALLFLNGALDRSRPAGTHYALIVRPSWRIGKNAERLAVSGATYSAVHTGQSVSIESHPGLFGLSWFSRVIPR